MLTLKNFEEQIPSSQIKKGREYFESGAVVELEEISKDSWQGTVEGTEIYTTTVTLSGNSVKETACDCPYDAEYCKHIVATLFEIREEKLFSDENPKSRKKESDSFPNLIKKVKNEDLRKFVEEHARTNKEFRTLFMLRFADRLKESGKEKYETLIKNIIRAAQERNGMIHYQGVQKMSRQLTSLLQEADQQLAKRNYLDPFNLAVTIIHEVYPLYNYSDDSSGSLQDCVAWSFNQLENIQASEAGYDLKERVFELALDESLNPIYRNFGLDTNWFHLMINGATDEEKQEKVLHVIERCIDDSRNNKSDTSVDYYLEELLRRKIKLLELMGRKEEARSVIENNLRIRSFRLLIIEEAIAKKDFVSAKELIKNSKLGDQQKGRLYESSEWDELLLKIAREENDIKSIRHLALQLYKDMYDLKYYRIIKATYHEGEWTTEIEKIVGSIRNDRNFGLTGIKAMASIFKEEKDWPRLLQLMQKNASLEFVEQFYELIKDKYPEELLDIYKEAIRRYAEHNMGNEHYAFVTNTLRKIQSLPNGNEISKSLAIELKVKYSQRRNMVKELNRLVF